MVVVTQVSAVCLSFEDRHSFPVPIALQGQGHKPGYSVEARSEQLCRSAHDLRSAERDTRPGVQQSSESARTFGGDQGGGDAQDLVQSGRYRSRCSCFDYTTLRIDHHQ